MTWPVCTVFFERVVEVENICQRTIPVYSGGKYDNRIEIKLVSNCLKQKYCEEAFIVDEIFI